MLQTHKTPAGTYRAEWKGERGEAIRILQFALNFRARRSLRSMLFEYADTGGGPANDTRGHFRALREVVAAGSDGIPHIAIREMLGRESWCYSCRDMVIPELLMTIGRVPESPNDPYSGSRIYAFHPRIAIQALRALETIEADWSPVVSRTWAGGELVVTRRGKDGTADVERSPMCDVVAREFERSEAIVGKDHDLTWTAIRQLAESADGTADVTAEAARRLSAARLTAGAPTLDEESTDAIVHVTLALDDEHARLFRDAVATIDRFRSEAPAADA